MITLIAYKLTDLFFRVKIQEIAKRYGTKFVEVSDLCSLNDSIIKTSGRILVVFDLMRVDSELDALSKIASVSTTMIAFYPHLEKEAAARARKAGISNVVPRSALESKLDSVLVSQG